jgi:MoaA/NifB/PqqE/SkfB family radical SAM enzyme
MRISHILRGWGCILLGRKPVLSIEITKECPLSCPGCYAYQPEHLGGVPLTSLADYKGAALVDGILGLVDRHRPVGVFLVGGEPLVRFRELNELLPKLIDRGVQVELVTSAVRPIPEHWSTLKDLGIVISVDGLQPEHDARRKPATYERILKHIRGHRVIVHCTVTSQMMGRDEYLAAFLDFWSSLPQVVSIRVSLFTPQIGETSREILSPVMRRRAVEELVRLAPTYPKLRMDENVARSFLETPSNPEECIFANTTHCVSADLETTIQPCQFGGNPDCSQCGCIATAGLHAVGRHRLMGAIPVSAVFRGSSRIGTSIQSVISRLPAGLGGSRRRRLLPGLGG